MHKQIPINQPPTAPITPNEFRNRTGARGLAITYVPEDEGNATYVAISVLATVEASVGFVLVYQTCTN
jgi:hypothetical protein